MPITCLWSGALVVLVLCYVFDLENLTEWNGGESQCRKQLLFGVSMFSWYKCIFLNSLRMFFICVMFKLFQKEGKNSVYLGNY